jgi:hypothetical protein
MGQGLAAAESPGTELRFVYQIGIKVTSPQATFGDVDVKLGFVAPDRSNREQK